MTKKCIKLVVEMLELYDLYNSHHDKKVANLSIKIGKYLGMKKTDLSILKNGALLHDVGKLLVHDDILNKPGKLDEVEREIIQTHPTIGANLLRKAGFSEKIINIAFYHHEWWDGSGYPEGLNGEEIPLMARIVSITSAFHVMTSKCIYSKQKTKNEAIKKIIKLKGVQFAPEIVDAFISSLE